MTTANPTSWKEHPVVTAAIAAAGAIGFTILIFKEIVIPTETASLQNEIAALHQQISAKDDKLRSIPDLTKQISDLKEALENTKTKLADVQLINLFQFGSPYPIGIDFFQIGDSMQSITKAFPPESIDRSHSSYWSVKQNGKVFIVVTYYFDKDAADKRVQHMLMFFDSSFDKLLQAKLIEALGQPTVPKPNCYIWKANQKLYAIKENTFTYEIPPTEPLCRD